MNKLISQALRENRHVTIIGTSRNCLSVDHYDGRYCVSGREFGTTYTKSEIDAINTVNSYFRSSSQKINKII
jgi:hypothetical protein